MCLCQTTTPSSRTPLQSSSPPASASTRSTGSLRPASEAGATPAIPATRTAMATRQQWSGIGRRRLSSMWRLTLPRPCPSCAHRSNRHLRSLLNLLSWVAGAVGGSAGAASAREERVRGGPEAACDRPAIRIRVGDLLRDWLRSAVRQVPVRKHEPPAAAAGMKQCDWVSSLKQASFIYC